MLVTVWISLLWDIAFMLENKIEGTIVDVSTPEEYLKEHFPNAINIPISEVPNRMNEFREMKKPIIAYCKSGNRSSMVINVLNQFGISEAINGGGLDDLRKN